MKLVILVIISTVFSQNQTLDLVDCIDISIKNKIIIKKNEFDLESSKLQLKESYGNILPSISFNANSRFYLQENIYEPTQFDLSSSYISKSIGFSISQDVFNGNIGLNRIAQSKNYIEIIKQFNRQNLINTILDVMISYYNLLKSKQILEVANSSLEKAEEQLKLIQKKYELGSAKKTDLLKAEVRKGQIRIEVINNNINLDNAYRNLKNAMGIIDDESNVYINDIDSSFFQIPLPTDLNELLSSIKKTNPTILAKEFQLNDAKYSKKIAIGARFPKISASANYWVDPNLISYDWQRNNQLNTGFNLSLLLFSGNKITSRIRQANLNVLKKEAEYLEQIQNLSARMQLIIDRLNNYNEILLINNTILMSAIEDVKLIKEKYSLGSASILELLDAEVSEISARSSIISAQYDILIEQASLNALLGKLDSDYK